MQADTESFLPLSCVLIVGVHEELLQLSADPICLQQLVFRGVLGSKYCFQHSQWLLLKVSTTSNAVIKPRSCWMLCTPSEILSQNMGEKLGPCVCLTLLNIHAKGASKPKCCWTQLRIVRQHVGLFFLPVEDGDLPCSHKIQFPFLHMESLLLHCQSSCRQNSWSFQSLSLLLM